jgi:predicted nucleic acid-binding Zn ribbon protein
MAQDPQYRQAHRDARARQAREWRHCLKEEDPEAYEEFLEYHRQRNRAALDDPVKGPRLRETMRRNARDRQARKASAALERLATTLPQDAADIKVKPCIMCGKPVVGRDKTAKYCSDECEKQYKLQQSRAPERHCKFCGITFQPKNGGQEFCIVACREAYQAEARRKPDKQCAVCGRTFTPKRHKDLNCSPECIYEYHRMTNHKKKESNREED